MLNTTWKLRVASEELDSWKVKAQASGKLLSEWIRARCNGEFVPEPSIATTAVGLVRESELIFDVDEGPSGKLVSVPVGRIEWLDRKAPNKLVKSCEHGVDKDYRCWQCGGLAKI